MGNGKYAAAKPVLRTDGKPLSKDYAQSPCLTDWDGDGDYDIVLGFIGGPVKLFLNNGSFVFTESGSFGVGGNPIKASDGGPCLIDWNGDGKLDLILGDGEGKVVLYPGKVKGSRDLGQGQTLVKGLIGPDAWKPRKRDPKSSVGFSPATPGVRTKPFAADWNGDGKLDLLVGDYLSLAAIPKTLNAKQKAELGVLVKQQREILNKMSAKSMKAMEEAYKKIGKSPRDPLNQEEAEAFNKVFGETIQNDKEYQATSQEYNRISVKVRALKPSDEGTGFVWVYLRK